MKLTSTITGKDRESISINLKLLAEEIRTGTDSNGRGHFGRDGDFDWNLEKEENKNAV